MIETTHMWNDGICKKCGSVVEEGSNMTDLDGDYMNRCTNPECENHIWHACADDESLDYYIHKR